MHSWKLFDPPFLGTLVNDTLWAAVERMLHVCMKCSQLDDLRPTESQTASKNLSYSSNDTNKSVVKQVCMFFIRLLHVLCMSFACPLHVLVLHSMHWGSQTNDIDSQQVSASWHNVACWDTTSKFQSLPKQARDSRAFAESEVEHLERNSRHPCRSYLPIKAKILYENLWSSHIFNFSQDKLKTWNSKMLSAGTRQPTQFQPFQGLHSPMPPMDQPTPLHRFVKRHSHNGSS